VIKWEREHRQRKEEERPISSAEDAAGMPIMQGKNTAPPAVMASQGAFAVIVGKNE